MRSEQTQRNAAFSIQASTIGHYRKAVQQINAEMLITVLWRAEEKLACLQNGSATFQRNQWT